MADKKIPCDCNNPRFIKKGCPQETFDPKTGDGCTKWKEYYQQLTPGGPKTLLIKGCTDILQEHWAFEKVKLLETLVKTNESFRNGMCETADDGNVYPKMDRAVLSLVGQIQRQREDKQLITKVKTLS